MFPQRAAPPVSSRRKGGVVNGASAEGVGLEEAHPPTPGAVPGEVTPSHSVQGLSGPCHCPRGIWGARVTQGPGEPTSYGGNLED